jgi:YD repeat-containing protein
VAKKSLVLSLAAAFLACTLCAPATAQSGSCPQVMEWYWGTQPSGINIFTPGCVVFWAEVITCTLPGSTCPPGASGQETQPRCPSCGSPISLGTGNTYIEEADIRIPGLAGGLQLVRTWNSIWPATQASSQTGLFGPNWRSTYEERVFLGSDGYVKYSRADGSFWSFGISGGTATETVYSPAAPANVAATLTTGSTYWTLMFLNGEQRLFDNTSGNLIAIIDRNGNTTQLSYNVTGFLATVTDPAARTLTFTYGNASFPGLVTAVTSSVGVSTSYTYDNQGRLLTVTEPDGSSLNFQYNAQSLISAVTDSQGIVLEAHTYDSGGRGLTSSRANGVDAVTVSYTN